VHDLKLVKREGPNIGFLLNNSKCEIITDDFLVAARFREVGPTIVHVSRHDAVHRAPVPVGSGASVLTRRFCNAISLS
jgi:hypothetical protein